MTNLITGAAEDKIYNNCETVFENDWWCVVKHEGQYYKNCFKTGNTTLVSYEATLSMLKLLK